MICIIVWKKYRCCNVASGKFSDILNCRLKIPSINNMDYMICIIVVYVWDVNLWLDPSCRKMPWSLPKSASRWVCISFATGDGIFKELVLRKEKVCMRVSTGWPTLWRRCKQKERRPPYWGPPQEEPSARVVREAGPESSSGVAQNLFPQDADSRGKYRMNGHHVAESKISQQREYNRSCCGRWEMRRQHWIDWQKISLCLCSAVSWSNLALRRTSGCRKVGWWSLSRATRLKLFRVCAGGGCPVSFYTSSALPVLWSGSRKQGSQSRNS